jgi:hypothetical protein
MAGGNLISASLKKQSFIGGTEPLLCDLLVHSFLLINLTEDHLKSHTWQSFLRHSVAVKSTIFRFRKDPHQDKNWLANKLLTQICMFSNAHVLFKRVTKFVGI